jgi:hypothetical protein
MLLGPVNEPDPGGQNRGLTKLGGGITDDFNTA